MPPWGIRFDPRIDIRSPEIVSLIVEIEAFKRSVLKIPLPPAIREKIDRLNIIRHIKGTTGIEGNTLSEERIGQVLVGTGGAPKRNGASLEEREVINAERVLAFIREDVKKNPPGMVTENLIRALHRLTTEGCNYPRNIPGEYRQHNVTVGEYRPPDYNDIRTLMPNFTELINSRQVVEGYQPLVRAILAHLYLISIHPFGDGNGRTSRALEAYILFHAGYNIRGFYSLANFYYRNRARYIEMLQSARFEQDGDMTEFVKFSLQGFVEELQHIQEDILAYVRRVLFRDVYLDAARRNAINARGVALLEYLTFDAPAGIPEEAFKNRTHHISKGLYDGKSSKTLLRDLASLKAAELVTVREGALVANLDLLTQPSS